MLGFKASKELDEGLKSVIDCAAKIRRPARAA